MKSLYNATVTSTGGRDGRSRSSDGQLELRLTTPKELGGAGGEGTNPEQLFAAGYSACFIGAMKYVANANKTTLSDDLSVTATVGIGDHPKGFGFAVCVDLKVSLPNMDSDAANKLVEEAHEICPYSNATRGNIEVSTTIV